MTLTNIQREMIVGCVLGDLHIEQSPNGQTARLVFEHSTKQENYVFHLYHMFKDWVPGEVKTRQRINGIKLIGFKTKYHGVFRFYRQQFYDLNGKKKISKRINKMLTPRSIAYWYMDDGSLKSKQSKGVILNTHAFSKKEIETLCFILNEKFKLQCKPRKQKHLYKNEINIYYQIYISGYSYETLRELIFSYLVPEMYYKFPTPRKKINEHICPKGNGGVQRFSQAGRKSAVECKGKRELDCKTNKSSRGESRP
jgi:LAGLIDADG DNA endonuclease family